MYNFILKLDMTITKLIGNNYVSIFYNYLDKEKVDIFFQNITKLGEGYFEIILTLFFIYMIKNTKQKEKYYFFIKGSIYTFLSSGIVVSILKRIIGRERPYVSFSPDRFYGLKYLYEHNLLWNSSYHSFPSGHTITIFTTIWFLSFNLKNKIVKLILFFIGGMVGVSRIYLSYHWTSDILFSIFLSYIIAKIVNQKLSQKKTFKLFKFLSYKC